MSGNAKYVIVGLLLLAGAAFLWMLVKPAAPAPVAPPPVVKAAERSTALATNDLVLDEPEPEPEPTPELTPEPTTKKKVAARSEWDCAGELTVEAVSKIMRAEQSQVRNCYERRLKANNMLQGDLNLKLKIGATGTVTATSAAGSIRDNEVFSCVRALADKWAFPAPTGGNCAVVQIPFRFTPKN